MKIIAVLFCSFLVIASISAIHPSPGAYGRKKREDSLPPTSTGSMMPVCQTQNDEGEPILSMTIPICIPPPPNEDGSLPSGSLLIPTCADGISSATCPTDLTSDAGYYEQTASCSMSIPVCVRVEPPPDEDEDTGTDANPPDAVDDGSTTVPPAVDDVSTPAPPAVDDASTTDPPTDDADTDDVPDNVLETGETACDESAGCLSSLTTEIRPPKPKPKPKPKPGSKPVKRRRCPKGFYYRAHDPDRGGKPVCFKCNDKPGYTYKFAPKRNGSYYCRYYPNRPIKG